MAPRKRHRSTDPDIRFRNMLEASGLPGMAGRSRMGLGRGLGRSGAATTSAVVSPSTSAAATNIGTALIDDPHTSVSVEHGLDATPDHGAISVTPSNNLGSATIWWLSNFTDTHFDINVDVAPGSSTSAEFHWHAHSSTTTIEPTPAAGYEAAVEADSPIGYWRLEEAAGSSTFVDEMGGDSLSATGHTAGVTGYDGGTTSLAVEFSSSSSGRASAAIPAMSSGVGGTIECWADLSLPQRGHWMMIQSSFGFGVGGSNFTNSGSTLFGLFEAVRWINTGVTLTSGWHHLAMSVDGSGTAKFYVDGSLVHTSTGSAPSFPSSPTLYIAGGTGAGRYFDGKIDEPAVYDQVLTGTQIGDHFLAA